MKGGSPRKNVTCVFRARVAGNYRFWLTVLGLVRVKSGNSSELLGFARYSPKTVLTKSCAAPRKRQIMMHGRKLSQAPPVGESKSSWRKIAFQVR